ncbi:MAG: ATP-binding protein [Pseudomonadota bacterium]
MPRAPLQSVEQPVSLRRQLPELALGSLAIFACTGYATELGMSHNLVVALWPASGVTLWLAWRYGWVAFPTIFLGHWLYGELFVPGGNTLASLGNTLAAVITIGLFRSQLKEGIANALRNRVWIIGPLVFLQAALAALLGGTVIVWKLGAEGEVAYELLFRYFLSDVTGGLIVAPMLFACSLQQLKPSWKSLRSPELLAAFAAIAAMVALNGMSTDFLSEQAKLLIVCTPLLFWLSMRPARFESHCAIMLISGAALTLASQNLNLDSQALLECQLFMCIFLASATLLQAILWQQEDLNRQLRDQSAGLERRVRLRTAELEDARKRAEEADAAKSEFLANTSHEVRTPLNAILGMAEFLNDSPLNDEQRQQTQTILSAGRNLMSVLNDVIDLSKVEAGKLEIAPEPTRIADLSSQIESLWRPIALDKGLKFELAVADAVPEHLSIDGHRLLQCVSNLLSNGIKFTEHGAITVRIDARQHGDRYELQFAVRDTGLGMTKQSMEKLFQPFEQLDSSITRRFGGTGLGLTITRRLVELMGGEVRVDSEPGQGSEFTIVVEGRPVPTEWLAEQTATAATPKLPESLRVLLVEDNIVNRRVARGHLKRFGWSFSEATNGLEALEHLEAAPFDLVLLDVHMPVMDGIETIKRIRSSTAPWRDMPVIALTADAMSEDRRRLLRLGMSGYASKPIDAPVLLQEISRVLAEHESDAEIDPSASAV